MLRAGVPLTERLSLALRYGLSYDEIGLSQSLYYTDPDGAGPLPATCPGGGANLRDGSCYPNVINFAVTKHHYRNWLPALTCRVPLLVRLLPLAMLSEFVWFAEIVPLLTRLHPGP